MTEFLLTIPPRTPEVAQATYEAAIIVIRTLAFLGAVWSAWGFLKAVRW